MQQADRMQDVLVVEPKQISEARTNDVDEDKMAPRTNSTTTAYDS